MENLNEVKVPKIITAIPGPKSEELLKVKEENVPWGVSTGCTAFAKRAQGAVIEDIDGNIFIDFAGAIGVQNIGHCHAEVVEAVKEQLDKFIHVNVNVFQYEQYTRLAERLNNLIPGDFKKKTMFVNTGAEANENAVKLARKYTKRTEIIAFTGAFHGRTYLTMALTSKVKPYKYQMGGLAPGVHRAPAPYLYRTPEGISKENAVQYYIDRLEDMFLEDVAPEEVAAIILEPVIGEGGFIVFPDEYIVALRKICDKHGILIIADEVQTSYGRTGKMFATNYWADLGVYADIVTTAKSVGAGIPISCVTARAEIFDAVGKGEIGGTYSGNVLAATAGLKVIEIMERDDFAGKANYIGEMIIGRLNEMKEKYEIIGDIRGRGAMIAVELVKDRTTKEPAAAETSAIVQECRKNGLIILNAGVRDNVIRFLTPLVITDDQLTSGLDILEAAMAKVTK